MISALPVTPIALQALAMVVDEFYFHRKRGLGAWERIGHPIDTSSVLLCYVWLLAYPGEWGVYAALVAVSCLLVTKDEWVHARACGPEEQWLHAVLFVLHPVVLILAAWIRATRPELLLVLQGQAVLIGLFMIYQIVYWNILWKPRPLLA